MSQTLIHQYLAELELRVPFGYWEAKDESDDLDAEIAAKFKRGYPQDNIVFEDSTQAGLEKLLKLFFGLRIVGAMAEGPR